MNCEIISKIKPEVTSPIPSCRRGTITTQGVAPSNLPLLGEALFKSLCGISPPPTGGVRGGHKGGNRSDLPYPLL